ncbi:hypothetical protein [Actinoplanes sp. NBRC 103695]|nr:hypothetical protein [Actinoplanes sp. NBRC 103695]
MAGSGSDDGDDAVQVGDVGGRIGVQQDQVGVPALVPLLSKP